MHRMLSLNREEVLWLPRPINLARSPHHELFEGRL